MSLTTTLEPSVWRAFAFSKASATVSDTMFAVPLLGLGIGALALTSRLDRHGRGASALLMAGVALLLLFVFAVVVYWAVVITVSDH